MPSLEIEHADGTKHGQANDAGDCDDLHLKNSMTLAFAEKKNVDLTFENARLKKKIAELEHKVEMEVHSTAKNDSVSLDMHKQLQKEFDEARRNETEAIRLAHEFREMKNSVKDRNKSLMEEVESLKSQVFNIRAESAQQLGQIKELREERNRLISEANDGQEKAKNDLESRIELIAELRSTQSQLEEAIMTRDWFNARYSEALEERNATNTSLNRAITTASKAKKDLSDIRQKLGGLKSSIAWTITLLDLVLKNFRLYTCAHANMEQISQDERYYIKIQTAAVTANDLFEEYRNDSQFMGFYNRTRSFVINHHVAHEQIGRGKGSESGAIRDELMSADNARGIETRY